MTDVYTSFLMATPVGSQQIAGRLPTGAGQTDLSARPSRGYTPWMMGLLWLLLGLIPSTQAQNFVWAKGIGGMSNDVGSSVAVDGQGNVYTTGSFNGTVDFDPGPGVFNLTSAGDDDIFVSKLDGSGNFVWAKRMGGLDFDAGSSVTVDGQGNVYVTGLFNSTADFDPGSGVVNLISAGGTDIVVSKLDAAGNFVWAKQLGGTSGDSGSSVAVDGSGNVYTTGSFKGTADFDPGLGVVNLTSAGESDIFVSKLNGSGNFVWAKQMGGLDFDASFSVVVDGQGNVYTTGSFKGTADFDPGPGVVNLTSVGGDDIFVSKLDATGNFIWAKQMGGTNADAGSSVAVDGQGNVYTTGYFVGTADFDPGAQVTNLISAGGSSNLFLSKLDGSGNFVWAKQMGSTTGTAGSSVAVDGSGSVYTTGSFKGTADFDPGSGVVNLTSAGESDIFVSKLDGSGNFVWAKRMGGIDIDVSSSVTVDGAGNTYTTGLFNSTADFNPGPGEANLTSVESGDIFVSKLSPLLVSASASPNPVCAGTTTALSVTALGGTAPFSYTWTAPAGISLSATSTSAVSASVGTGVSGVQTFTVTVVSSDNSPSSTTLVNITVNPVPTVSITPNPSLTIIQGTTTTLTASGASSYQWASGETTAAISVSMAGTYSVTGTTENCSSMASLVVTVNDITPTLVDFYASPDPLCVGSQVTFQAIVGNVTGSYTYTLTNGSSNITGTSSNTSFSQSLTTTSSGIQAFTLAVSSNGQSATATYELTVNAPPMPTLMASNGDGVATSTLTCAQTTITLKADGGDDYLFSGTSILSQDPENGIAVVNAAGVYSVTVTNSETGCFSTTTTTVSSNTTAPTISISPSSATLTCTSPMLSLSVIGSGTIEWSTGESTEVISVSTAATYSVLLTSIGGCSSTASVTVSANQSAPSISINPSSTTLSNGSPTASLTAVGAGTYRWSTGATTQVISVSASGTYSVTLTSPGGCAASASVGVSGADLTVVLDLPQANFAASGTASVGNFVVNVFEVSGLPTSSGNVTITLTAPIGYTLAFSGSLTSINISGGEHNPVAVDNPQWTVTQSLAERQLTLTMNAGAFIGGGGESSLGFQISRTTANSGSTANITVNVSDDLTMSYDSNLNNNVYARIISGL